MRIISLEQVRQSRGVEQETPVSKTKKRTNAIIYPIATNIFRIHPERITERDVTASDFFDALSARGLISILSPSDSVVLFSILGVGNEDDGESFDMSVKDFVRLTEPGIGHTKAEKLHDFVLDSLASAGIRVEFIQDPDMVDDERDFLPEDMENFNPEAVMVSWVNDIGEVNSYDCMIEELNGMGVFTGSRMFSDPFKTPLLSMLVHLREEYRLNGGSETDDEKIIELCMREGEFIDTTNIPLSFLDAIIVKAIRKSHTLFAQLKVSDDELIKRYYQRKVIDELHDMYSEGE